MRDYGKVHVSFWTSDEGTHRVPSGKLSFKYPLHAKLRAYVYTRDHFTCAECGARPAHIPIDYDGRNTLFIDITSSRRWSSGNLLYLVIDHIVSRRNGGSNHPTNLSTLCGCCNSRKSALVDSKVRHQ